MRHTRSAKLDDQECQIFDELAAKAGIGKSAFLRRLIKLAIEDYTAGQAELSKQSA